MSLTATLTHPLYTGAGATLDVPGKFAASIGGRPYIVDTNHDSFGFRSIALVRTQADTADRPSERSLNPEDLWRRSAETWHKGAGQTYLDRPDSDVARFDVSKGIDPWTKFQVCLLPDTDKKRTSAETNLAMVVAGSRLYLTDGNDVLYTTDATVDAPTWTALTGIPATDPTSITSDGFNVYTAHGADGIYKTDSSSGATASFVTGTASLVRYVKARLMAAEGGTLYNLTGSGALPPGLLTHPNADFEWVDFAEGIGHIYAAGFSGDKSELYRIAVKADGTALDTPVIAGRLPDGEIVRAIEGYLGFILIGSDKGIRFATSSDAGDLTIGGLIPMDNAPRCFEGQDRFVWFGWTNYDATSTGLGRMDLTAFNGSAPAYASDLMATAQGTVTSVVTFGDRRYFTVSGAGVWGEDTAKVATGTIDSGFITYGLPEQKRTVEIDTRHLPLDGTYEVWLAVDDGAFTKLGTRSTADSTDPDPLPTNQLVGELIEVRLVLLRDASDTTACPEITRWTLRSEPLVKPSYHVTLPVLLYEDLASFGFPAMGVNPEEEREALTAMWQDHRLINVQVGATLHSGFMVDWAWEPHHLTESKRQFNGTFVARVKVI